MRLLLNVTLPNAEFNAAVRDGSAGSKIGRILEEARPEAVYFTERDGTRGATLIINIDNPSQIPSYCEPWFLTFNGTTEIRIAMTPEDLRNAGLEELGKKWS